MTVRKIYDNEGIYSVSDIKELNLNSKILFETMILCNDATSSDKGATGDPTEVALVNLAHIYGLKEIVIRNEFKRLKEIPFDSDRKLMSTVHTIDNKTIMFTKGAFDVLFK